ncbi:MAG: GNAT family N-acetyltransferase [Bacteroidetes bacterium]|nr:GNAT family N-acetyltransferase [Bacteroidota bacterium]
MNSIQIRYATTGEAALIADISRETFYETFAADNTVADMEIFMTEQFSREKLMAEVGEPGNIFLLAMEGDQAIGYVRMRENNNPPELAGKQTIEIARIYARSAAIGKGVGKALLHRCEEIAREQKKEYIWLGVWEHNQRAIAFYERNGFTQFSTHEFLLGTDPQTDWLMKKALTY